MTISQEFITTKNLPKVHRGSNQFSLYELLVFPLQVFYCLIVPTQPKVTFLRFIGNEIGLIRTVFINMLTHSLIIL